jgi:hypothetical protein
VQSVQYYDTRHGVRARIIALGFNEVVHGTAPLYSTLLELNDLYTRSPTALGWLAQKLSAKVSEPENSRVRYWRTGKAAMRSVSDSPV